MEANWHDDSGWQSSLRTDRLSRSWRPARLAGAAAWRWSSAHLAFDPERRRARREEALLRTAEDVTRTMGDMKGAIMKIGQVLSMMAGVLPDELASQLASLHSSAPPMSFELVEQVFQQAYGHGPQKLFKSFERRPFAAASIGQVHRAILHDGSLAAVKVQYPGVAAAIEHDLSNAGFMIGLSTLVARGLEAGPIIRDLKDGIRNELDYRREADWQQRFYDAFEGHAFVRIPKVYHDLSTSTVLVQEYIEGLPFAAARDLPQADRDRLGEIIYRFCFGSLYRYGLFNGDPHPGNYLLLPGGRVAFLDFGCVSEFSPRAIDGFKRIIRELMADDRPGWRAAVEDLGILKPGAPFTTDELYAHMHWYWAPILTDQVTFTPDLAAEMVRRNTQTTGPGGAINRWCNVPEGMIFLTRINFGLAGLFAGLRSRGPWRSIVEEYVDDLPPSTDLGRLSARTSRGPSV